MIQDFSVDLAASLDNRVTTHFYSEDDSALDSTNSWNWGGWAWCNPPFANIKPWVEKAVLEERAGANIAMLLPAAVGSNWWRDYVHDKACVLFINGRLTFVGTTAPYPKDCALVLYGWDDAVYDVWNWREE